MEKVSCFVYLFSFIAAITANNMYDEYYRIAQCAALLNVVRIINSLALLNTILS